MNASPLSPAAAWLQALRRAVACALRVLTIAAGAVVALLAMAIGLLLAAALLAWARLRGRPAAPVRIVRFGGRRPASAAEVVDVDAREVHVARAAHEVHDAPPRLDDARR